jgi:hypothetical protein
VKRAPVARDYAHFDANIRQYYIPDNHFLAHVLKGVPMRPVALVVASFVLAATLAGCGPSQQQVSTEARTLFEAALFYAGLTGDTLPETLPDLYELNQMDKGDYSKENPLRISIAEVYTDGVQAKQFIAPTSSVSVPSDFADRSLADKKEWLQANASYILLTGGTEYEPNADRVAMVQKPDHASGDRLSVVYMDGHVEAHSQAEANTMLDKQFSISLAKAVSKAENGTLTAALRTSSK